MIINKNKEYFSRNEIINALKKYHKYRNFAKLNHIHKKIVDAVVDGLKTNVDKDIYYMNM